MRKLHWISVRQSALRAATAIVVASSAACGTNEADSGGGANGRAPDSVPPQTASGAVSPTVDAASPRPLPKSWEDMEQSDWIAHVDVNPFDTQKAWETKDHRVCGNDPDSKPSKDCDLRITPVRNAHRLDTASIDARGVILARIQNVDAGRAEKMLKLPRLDSTYWVAFRDNNGRLRSVFVKPREKGKMYNGYRSFAACPDSGHAAHPETYARFRKCEERFAHLHPSAAVDTVLRRTEHHSPPWITCAEGCCNAENAIGGGG